MKPAVNHFDEITLLESFRRNDPDAFKVLFDMYNLQLHHYASRFISAPDQIEDIISESFVIIWQKRLEFNSLKSIAAYLYTVTRNACFSYLRKANKRASVFQELTYLNAEDNAEDIVSAVKSDLIQFSIIAARDLPAEMKKVFQLIYIEGYSASETAEKLSLSVHTVKAQKANAVKRIRQHLKKKGLLIFIF